MNAPIFILLYGGKSIPIDAKTLHISENKVVDEPVGGEAEVPLTNAIITLVRYI